MTFSSTPMENILNCNLELCLSPPSSSPTAAATASNSTSTSSHDHINPTRVPVVDLTELQARAIIVRGTTQIEVERRLTTCRISSLAERVPMKSGASPSMRRSLQRFLQMRKHRIQSLSPYTH